MSEVGRKPTDDEMARMARHYGADGVIVILRYADGSRGRKSWGATPELAQLLTRWLWTGWDWLIGQEGE